MTLKLEVLQHHHIDSLFQLVEQLRGDAHFSLRDFKIFIENIDFANNDNHQIYIGLLNNEVVGYLVLNRFLIPRFIGWGVELEEVVVDPKFQNRGIGSKLIALLIEIIRKDKKIRKIIVKTDDDKVAGRLYRKHFDALNTTVFSTLVHPV